MSACGKQWKQDGNLWDCTTKTENMMTLFFYYAEFWNFQDISNITHRID